MKPYLLVLLCLLIFPFLTGCTANSVEAITAVDVEDKSASNNTTSDQTSDTPPLQIALSLLPAHAHRAAFTDWQQLKQHHQLPALTSHQDMPTRSRFMRQVLQGSQAPAAMDSAFFRYQAENWGWDSTDLLWEAAAHFEQMTASVHILRFRDDYDFSVVTSHLQQSSEYDQIEIDDTLIYAAPLTTQAEWHDRSPLAHHNMAVLADEHLLIMSPVAESVQAVLAVRYGRQPALSTIPTISQTMPQLVGLAGVDLYIGQATCEQFNPSYQGGHGTDLGATQLSQWPAQPYQLLAAGHIFNVSTQADKMIFVYEDTAVAATDFELRQNLLRQGKSPLRETPYSQQFVLEEATQTETLLTFVLIPSPTLPSRPGWPQTISGWLQAGDALFAACQLEMKTDVNGIR